MKNTIWIIGLLLSLGIVSCKTDNSTRTTSENQSKMEELRYKDLSHLSSDQKSKWTFLTLGYFQKEVELRGEKVLNMDSIANQWIKFYDDHTYAVGNQSKITASGRWTYEQDKTLIQWTSDDPKVSKLEYKVLSKDDYIVLVGTSKYGNNNQQIKCVRIRD